MTGDLARRSLTGVVAGAVAFGDIWAGGLLLVLTGLACIAVLHWEWMGLTLPGAGVQARAALTAAAVALAALVASHLSAAELGRPATQGSDMTIVGVAATLFVLGAIRLPDRAFSRLPLYALWPFWFGPALVGLLWLRQEHGVAAALWPVAVVVMTDIGGYAAGRSFGGRKLAPRLSPSKTWSGLVGGLVLGMAAGGGFLAAIGAGVSPMALFAAFAVALAAVLGDLAQSAIKRRAGVKDSGGLLPGHGGLFDRLDGHLFALPLAAAVVWISGWPL